MYARRRRGCVVRERRVPRRRFDLAPTVTVSGGYTRQRLSSAVVSHRGRHLPGPGYLGWWLRRVMGAGSVRAGPAERSGSGRVRGGKPGRSSRHPGVTQRLSSPGRISSCGERRSSSRWRSEERRQSAPQPSGDAPAAGGGPGHRLRHRTGAGAAELYARVDPHIGSAGAPGTVSDRGAGGPTAGSASLRSWMPPFHCRSCLLQCR